MRRGWVFSIRRAMGFAVPDHESDAVAAGLVGAQMVHSGLWEGRQRGLRRRSVLLDEGRNIAHDVDLDAVEAVVGEGVADIADADAAGEFLPVLVARRDAREGI